MGPTEPQAGTRNQGTGRSGFVARSLAMLIVSTSLACLALVLFGLPAFADIGACAEVQPPQNEARALERAGFAFDGVVIGGREVQDPTTGQQVLVSPLRFRVIRSVKGNVADYAKTLPSGSVIVTLWDAQYANQGLRRQVRHQEGPDERLPEELATQLGARWRIYGLSGFGNWTATTCLGSHPIKRSSVQTSPKPESSRSFVWLLVLLVGFGSICVIGWRIVRARRSRSMRDSLMSSSSSPS
jgi:hypothetical protein